MSDSDELGKLGDLHQRGVLSDTEFLRAKERVLGGSAAPDHASHEMSTLNDLRRSRYDRWFGGVCGGLGYFTGIPSWIWRLFFTILVLCCGTGLVAYILLWIFVPQDLVQRRLGNESY